MAGFRLPSYEYPQNALLNLAPVNSAIDDYRKREQQGVDNAMAQKRLGFEEQRLGMQRDQFNEQKQQRIKERAGNLALLALQEPDEQRRAQKWGSFIATHPDAKSLDPKYHDINTGPLTVLADAGMAQQYLDYQMKRSAEARAAAAEGRAAAMHGPQLATAQLQYNSAKRDFDNPVQSVDLAPDHVRVIVNKQTGQEVSRIAGPPKGPDSTSRKAIYEAQDELPNIRGSIDLLNEAKTLLGTSQQPGIYTGYGAQLRSNFNQAAPGILPNIITDPKTAQNTQRYNQIMTAEAINAMSQTLKGATTDNEMRAFVNIMNDPSVGVDVKQRVINQTLTAAQRHYKNKEDRIKELGGRMPDLGGGPAAAPSSRPRAVNPTTGQAVEWNGSAWVPAQ